MVQVPTVYYLTKRSFTAYGLVFHTHTKVVDTHGTTLEFIYETLNISHKYVPVNSYGESVYRAIHSEE